METVMVKVCESGVNRTYEFHLDGAKIIMVFNHQNGTCTEMPYRAGRTRSIHENKSGRYIKLGKHKHYLK